MFSISAKLACDRGAIKICELHLVKYQNQKEIFKNGTFLNFENPMDFLYAMGILIINKLISKRADGTLTLGKLANSASAKTPNVFADDSTSP